MGVLKEIIPVSDSVYEQMEQDNFDQLINTKYSSENIERVKGLKERGLPAKVAHNLARGMQVYGPILTDPNVLSNMSDEEILSIPGIGPKSLNSIRELEI